MRISDWSSDVCSSDLGPRGRRAFPQDIMAIGAKQHRLAGQSDHMFPGGQGRIEQRFERGAAATERRRPRRGEEAGKKAEPVANARQWQVERPTRRETAAKGADRKSTRLHSSH